jgi:SagB-type dehydrogenase family enzyme
MDEIGKVFLEKTKPENLSVSPQKQGLLQPPLELPFPAAAALIALPGRDDISSYPTELRTLIEARKTLRRYQEASLSIQELSGLLWMTQGVKGIHKSQSTIRNVPSAGARHAFETFLLVNRVAGLDPGLYRYLALENALLPLDVESGIGEKITEACFNQQQVPTSAVTFIWVAVTERMTWRYVERGYRYLHLDAGHVCQNLYLAAEAMGCGVCAIAAFDDDLLNAALGLDGESCFAIYLGTVGKR